MSQKESSVQVEREEQLAQKPDARVGDNQDNRVPTNEGSLLDSPTLAGESEGSTPHLSE